jgi:hypothetical protein
VAYIGVQAIIPVGGLGLLTDTAPGSLPLGALIAADNVVINQGTVQKAPGAYVYNSTELDGAIVGLRDWWPDPFTQRLIAVTAAGSIYKDNGNKSFSGGTAINTGLGTIDPRCQFTDGGNETAGRSKKLFLTTDGRTQVKVLNGDGTSFADIATPAVDWVVGRYPRCGITHRNRMWMFSGQRAYASNSGDHEDFVTSILTQSIFPGEGGDIIGAYVFKGRLFAFKEGEFVYYLDDSNTDSTNWFWRKLASNFGLASPNAIINALDDMLVGNATGTITSYKAADTLGEIESADLLRIANIERYLRRTTNTVGIDQMHAIYDEELKQAYFTYRSTYRTSNDMLLSLDLNSTGPRFTYLKKGNPVCLELRRGQDGIRYPIYGSENGKVYEMNREDRLEGDAAYEGSFQTAHYDFANADPKFAHIQKAFDHIWIEFVQEGDVDLSIDIIIDGIFSQTVTTKLELTNKELGVFSIGSDRLAEYTTLTSPIPIAGMGRRISFRCYNAGSNESFQIAAIGVGFRPTHEGVTRY